MAKCGARIKSRRPFRAATGMANGHLMAIPPRIMKDVVLAIVAAVAVACTSLVLAGVPIALVLDNAERHPGSTSSAGWTMALCASGLLGIFAAGYTLVTLRTNV